MPKKSHIFIPLTYKRSLHGGWILIFIIFLWCTVSVSGRPVIGRLAAWQNQRRRQRPALLAAAVEVCDVGVQRRWRRIKDLQVEKNTPQNHPATSTSPLFIIITWSLNLKVALALRPAGCRPLRRWPERDSRDVTVDSGDRQSLPRLLDSILYLHRNKPKSSSDQVLNPLPNAWGRALKHCTLVRVV